MAKRESQPRGSQPREFVADMIGDVSESDGYVRIVFCLRHGEKSVPITIGLLTPAAVREMRRKLPPA